MAPKKTDFIVGNPMVERDSMPLKILPMLQKALPQFEFVLFESTRMDIPQKEDLVFVDTVEGAKEVIVLEGVSRIEEVRACSLHDFDLGTQLKLLDKFGLLGNVKIIGVPEKGKTAEIGKKVSRELGAQ